MDPVRPQKTLATAVDMDHAVTKNKTPTTDELHKMARVMTHYHPIPELLEEYMQAHDCAGRWVTVPEFHTYFQMDEFSAPAISGLFRRLSQGSFLNCPYRVVRIEKLIMTTPQRRTNKRYLII